MAGALGLWTIDRGSRRPRGEPESSLEPASDDERDAKTRSLAVSASPPTDDRPLASDAALRRTVPRLRRGAPGDHLRARRARQHHDHQLDSPKQAVAASP